MDQEEYRWLVELVQDRYEYLALTFEQAEQVYHYEQVVAEPACDAFLTRWEELDFELVTMRRALSAQQFTLFLAHHSEALEFYREQLREMDAAEEPKLGYYRALLRHFREVVLPALYAALDLRAVVLDSGQHRLRFIQEPYQWQLRCRWKSVVADHFRSYRSIGTRTLEVLGLQHEIVSLWPDYQLFVSDLDKPARRMVRAVLQEADYLVGLHEAELKEQDRALSVFMQQLHKEYFGLHAFLNQGFHFPVAENEGQYRANWVFRLLCLSQDAPSPFSDRVSDEEPMIPEA